MMASAGAMGWGVVAYSYDRRARGPSPIEEYGLQGMLTGAPVTLYHGTTRLFRRFDMSQSRDELVDQFYGKGIFLTPSKRVAAEYANANRNIGFPPSLVGDLKRKNPAAGRFLEILVGKGDEAWELAIREAGFWRENPPPGEGAVDLVGFQDYLGVDPNTVGDVAAYVLGSKVLPLERDSSGLDLFTPNTGAPDHIYDSLDELGLDSKTYRPKVYTVKVTVSRPLVTKSKAQARSARQKGYDSVVFYGSDLVLGVPEVAVYDPRNVRIQKIEVY